MAVCFASSRDIRSVLPVSKRGNHSPKPKQVGGTVATFQAAIDEVIVLLRASKTRWSSRQLYNASHSARQRWPLGAVQGAKAIHTHLLVNHDRYGIRHTRDGLWLST